MLLCGSVRLVVEIKITVIHFLVTQNLYLVGFGAKHTKLEESKRKFKETLPSASHTPLAACFGRSGTGISHRVKL